MYQFHLCSGYQNKKNVVYIDALDYLTYGGDLNGTTFSDLDGNDLFFISYHTKTETKNKSTVF